MTTTNDTISTGDSVIVTIGDGSTVRGVACSYSFVFGGWYVKGDDGTAYCFIDGANICKASA